MRKKDNLVLENNEALFETKEVEEKIIADEKEQTPAKEPVEEIKEDNNVKDVAEAPKTGATTFNSLALGSQSNNIKTATKVVKIDAEARKKLEAPYRKYIDSKEIIWGRVVSVIYDKDPKTKVKRGVGIVCDWNGKEVIIPDHAYFQNTRLLGGVNYEKMNKEEQIELKNKVASYQIGAIVCFVVTSVTYGKKGIGFIGNRTIALEKLQDFYFTHEHYKQTEENTLQVGSCAIARVLAVRSHNVLVECCGVETFIDSGVLTNIPVENCRDVVSVGDTIEVRIRKIYPEDKYLTVTGKTSENSQAISDDDVDTIQLVHFIKQNSSGTLTFRMKNGVNVVVTKNNLGSLRRAEKLVEGDNVIVKITGISKERRFYFGTVIAKR